MRVRKFGRTDLVITELGLGGSPLGNRGTAIGEPQADAIVESAWDQGIRYYDTAPLYGHGLAEARLGHGLRWKPRDEFVVSSKVGRILTPARRETVDYGPGRAVCRSNAATTIRTTGRGAHLGFPATSRNRENRDRADSRRRRIHARRSGSPARLPRRWPAPIGPWPIYGIKRS